jgi:hypothetical protein
MESRTPLSETDVSQMNIFPPSLYLSVSLALSAALSFSLSRSLCLVRSLSRSLYPHPPPLPVPPLPPSRLGRVRSSICGINTEISPLAGAPQTHLFSLYLSSNSSLDCPPLPPHTHPPCLSLFLPLSSCLAGSPRDTRRGGPHSLPPQKASSRPPDTNTLVT